jgi:hypothetical protein
MRRAAAAILLAAGLVFAGYALRYRDYLVDDAFISLRYARNWVDGQGLVFNPRERVEGYTNFLWLALAAALLRAGFEPILGLKLISLASAVGLLLLVHRMDRRWSGPGPIPAAAWLLGSEAFAYWSTTAMEAMAFSALMLLGIDRALREAQLGRTCGASAILLLLALLRPEGLLVFGLATSASALVERRRTGAWPWRRLAAAALTFGLPYGTFLGWRWSYYGALVPNTFHAKVTGGAEQWLGGLLALRGWAIAAPMLALAVASILVRRRPIGRPEPPEVERLVVGWIALMWILYTVAIGGDFMPFHRFTLPVMAPAALLLSAWLAPWGWTRRWAPGLWIAHVVAGSWTAEPYRAFVSHRTTLVGAEVGRWFAERLAPDSWMAVNTAGSLPYASRLPTIDMLGLTDPVVARHPVFVVSPSWVAHRRGHGAYVIERRPQVILFYNTAGLAEPHYLSDHQLADAADFRFFYQLKTARLQSIESDPRRPLERFFGDPFEIAPRSHAVLPELGTGLELHPGLLRHTRAHPAPIGLVYFELRGDRLPLWPLRRRLQGEGVESFVRAVAVLWAGQPAPDHAPIARGRVEALCDRAQARVEAGDRAAAKRLLSAAAAIDGGAGSARVFQYIANLAVLEGQLFLAVQAQSEALRLEPQNLLFRHNLASLLAVRYRDFARRPPRSS